MTTNRPTSANTAVPNDDNLAAPAGLGPDGLRLWASITDGLDVDDAEQLVLEQACHVADSLAALNTALADDAANIEILRERRQQQVVFTRLLTTLRIKFGDEDTPVPTARPRGGYGIGRQR